MARVESLRDKFFEGGYAEVAVEIKRILQSQEFEADILQSRTSYFELQGLVAFQWHKLGEASRAFQSIMSQPDLSSDLQTW